jgi:glycosyltransferase involved in cell wall biosynthesis
MTRRQRAFRRLRSGARRVRARLADPPASAHRIDPGGPSSGSHRTPDDEPKTTHLGPAVDRAVLQFKRRMRVDADSDYDLVRQHFDPLHYLLQSPGLFDQPELDLVEHFLEHGLDKRLSPHPDFSMVEYVRRYRRRLRDSSERSPYLAWLKHGKAKGEIADPAPRIARMAHVLNLSPEQLVDDMVNRRSDLQQRIRTGRLGEMFARAAEIEPLIGDAWTEISRPMLLPLSTPASVDEVSAIYRAQEAVGFRRARLVLVMNRGRWGGGRRMEGHIAHAVLTRLDPDQIVVLHTDDTMEAPPGRYPEGVRQIDFARIARDLREERAQHALVTLLRSFRADAIVNVNSRMLYRAMPVYGEALADTERIFLVFFSNAQSAMGTWRGYSLRYFQRTFDHVTGVITDSQFLARELADRYRLGPNELKRLHPWRAPVDPGLPVVPFPRANAQPRPQVFWAGRWDREKRVDLFLEVCRRMPDVDFRMWGETVLGGWVGQIPPNVSVLGSYRHISEIPLAHADVWLYTSAYDGVPSQLLEVAMTGIPIVGSLVGGTGEVLGEDDAWPVAEREGAATYVRAVRAVLADPAAARRRALRLRDRMLRERTAEDFAVRATSLLLYDDGRDADR